jgi:formate dehydrogenase subunit gamma
MNEAAFYASRSDKETHMQPVKSWEITTITTVKDLVRAGKSMPGAMLPILHGIQEAIGYIPSDAVPIIADELNVSQAEVHGVITYYHHFRQESSGKRLVQLCRAEACQARGADELVAHAKAVLGCDFHETTADGEVTLEPVYCLGQCAVGPNMTIGDELHARITPEKFDTLINAKRVAK